MIVPSRVYVVIITLYKPLSSWVAIKITISGPAVKMSTTERSLKSKSKFILDFLF